MRLFFKCRSCNGVWATDYRPVLGQNGVDLYWRHVGRIKALPCPHCAVWPAIRFPGDGNHYMGPVDDRDSIDLPDTERSHCDRRCTTASGPNCRCLCHGDEHGRERLVCMLAMKGVN